MGGNNGNRYFCTEVKDVNQNDSTFPVEFEDSEAPGICGCMGESDEALIFGR